MRALLSKNKKGVVLITSSVAGLAGNYVAALYCATKHAMVGFVKSMSEADELEGVKVVAICPGYVLLSYGQAWRPPAYSASVSSCLLSGPIVQTAR